MPSSLAQKLCDMGPSKVVVTGVEHGSSMSNVCFERGREPFARNRREARRAAFGGRATSSRQSSQPMPVNEVPFKSQSKKQRGLPMTAFRQASIWAFRAPMASRSKRSCTRSPNSATQAWPRKRRVVSIGATRWKWSIPHALPKTRTETAAYHAKRTATSRTSPSGRSNRNPH